MFFKSKFIITPLLILISYIKSSYIIENTNMKSKKQENFNINKNTKIIDIINNPIFSNFGRYIFPIHQHISSSLTIENLSSIYTWYNYMNPNKTIEIINYFIFQIKSGFKIFYDIYTEEEKKLDPSKKETGLFFFRGNPNSKFAIVNAGGAFSYVGAMHDSFPQALEISKNGFNAFALIYRQGGQNACKDLAAAIRFIFKNQKELNVNTKCYSLWGGSAGARMAAWVGSENVNFGNEIYPKAGTIIMQYTGLSEVTGNEPPTYANCGTDDWIANYRVMNNRINKIKKNGTDAMMEIFNGLPHGFGLGQGTIAEGWINNAINFWKKQMK